MTAHRKRNSLGREMLVAVGIMAVLAAAAGFVTWRLAGSPGESEVLWIDFTDAVATPVERGSTRADRRPQLRVAVGAMTSPEATHELYGALLEVVAGKLGRRAVLAQRKTYAETNHMLEHGEVDLAFVCSAPYVLGHDRFGLEILVVPVVGGQKTYRAYILARADSMVRSFDDLRGHVFAFTDPQSNTGCLLPKFLLHQRAENPQTFFSDYYYTHGHDNSIRAVAEGLADGAAVDSLVWEHLNRTNPEVTARTKIIARSEPFGIPPVVVPPGLEPELKAELRRVFLSLHRDEQGGPLMRSLGIDRFEEGDDSAYESVRKMLRILGPQTGKEP